MRIDNTLNTARLAAMLIAQKKYFDTIKKEISKESIEDRNNNIKKATAFKTKGFKLSIIA